MIRKAWGLGKTFIGPQLAGSPLWFNHPATQMIVLWPEWPRKSYFEIPPEERLRRINSFGSALSESERLTALEYLLNPHNPATKKKGVIEISILSSVTLPEYHEALDALLRIRVPELFRGAKAPAAHPRGRKSEEARVLDDLNAFAAWYLCRVQKMPRAQAIELICYPKGHPHSGKQVYKRTNELTRPLQRFLRLQQQFLNEIMGNLVPLKPELFGM
jgi:hypothetical protein